MSFMITTQVLAPLSMGTSTLSWWWSELGNWMSRLKYSYLKEERIKEKLKTLFLWNFLNRLGKFSVSNVLWFMESKSVINKMCDLT